MRIHDDRAARGGLGARQRTRKLFPAQLCQYEYGENQGLAVAAHPYTTYPLSLAVAKALKRARSRPGQETPVSIDIVFCAFNEEGVIGGKLDNVLALLERDPTLRARVYIDGSEDRTPQIVAGRSHERLHVIESAERGGKSRGMNALLAESTADAVIFTDANVLLADDVADVVREALRQIEINLPRAYYRQLEQVRLGESGSPRTLELAREILKQSDVPMDMGWLEQGTMAYQSVSPLTLGELWALPLRRWWRTRGWLAGPTWRSGICAPTGTSGAGSAR